MPSQKIKNNKWLSIHCPNWIESKSIKKVLKKNISNRTFQMYKYVLKNYFEYIKLCPDEVIEERKKDLKSDFDIHKSRFNSTLLSYKNMLIENGYKNSTVIKYMSIISLFFERSGIYSKSL